MVRLLAVLLNVAGVVSLWFGGVPYSTRETLVNLGPIKADHEVKRTIVVPPEVGAGMVGVGTALLLFAGAGGRKK